MSADRAAIVLVAALASMPASAGSPDTWFIQGAASWLKSIANRSSLENDYRLDPDLVAYEVDRNAFAYAAFANGYMLGFLKQAGFPSINPCERLMNNTAEAITTLAMWIQRNEDKAEKLWNGQIVHAMLTEEYGCK